MWPFFCLLSFSSVLPLFSIFLLFWYSSCMLHVCLGAPFRFFNVISFITYINNNNNNNNN
jgi:hypothetical protein